MNSRLILVALLALAAGVYAGLVIPQGEIRKLEAKVRDLETKIRERGGSSQMAMAGVESMLQIRSSPDQEPERPRGRVTIGSDADPIEVSVATQSVVQAEARPARSISNQIDQVREVWDTRRQIARGNFVERANLNPDQATQFDVLIEAMNLRLGSTVDKWAAEIRAREAFTPESGIRMMNEMSAALVLTYDEMDRSMPEGWREQAGPKFELVRFVDPEILTPLENIEDIMQRGPGVSFDEEEEPVPTGP